MGKKGKKSKVSDILIEAVMLVMVAGGHKEWLLPYSKREPMLVELKLPPKFKATLESLTKDMAEIGPKKKFSQMDYMGEILEMLIYKGLGHVAKESAKRLADGDLDFFFEAINGERDENSEVKQPS